MESLASIDDLAARTGDIITADDVQAEWILDTASTLVRKHAGLTWATTTVPDDVRRITVEVAARVWQNPTGNVQETVGPFTERRPEIAADGFYLTGTEKSVLAAYRPSGLGGLWTIQQTKGDAYDPNTYVPVTPQPGENLPYYVPGTPGAQGL